MLKTSTSIVRLVDIMKGGIKQMFKNSVLKSNVNVAKWFKAASIRAIKTVAQTAIATIGTSVTMGEVNWIMVGSASLLSGIISILTSIAGIPEVKEGEEDE